MVCSGVSLMIEVGCYGGDLEPLWHRRGCCHCERRTKRWFRLAIKGNLLPISGKTHFTKRHSEYRLVIPVELILARALGIFT